MIAAVTSISTILAAFLFDQIYNAMRDLDTLEAVDATYKISSEAVRVFGIDTRVAIGYVLFGIFMILVLTGCLVAALRDLRVMLSYIGRALLYGSISIWILSFVTILEFLLFLTRAHVTLTGAGLPEDVSVEVTSVLTNLDQFRWLGRLIFSIVVAIGSNVTAWTIVLLRREERR